MTSCSNKIGPSGSPTAAIEQKTASEIQTIKDEGLTVSEVGVGKYPTVPFEERQVGIAYTTWHQQATWDATKMWSMPQLGSYKSNNREVIKKHGEWLSDAGVDFIFVDWSNDIDYEPLVTKNRADFKMIEDSTKVIFEEYSKMEKSPKISIFLGCPGQQGAVTDGRLTRKANQIYDWFCANPTYRALMQEYLGKPLLVVYANTPTHWPSGTPEWNDDRFTVRWMTGFVTEQTNLQGPDLLSKYGYWSWEERGAQTYTIFDNKPESMTVVAGWRPQGEPGDKDYIAPGERNNGKTFKEQWARARLIGPKFVLIPTWNEWTKGEQPSIEVSKDIEPSEAFGTFYLDLMKQEIAKFKGK